MARIHTLNNISNLDPPPKTFKDRYCPGMRSCWHLDPVKFDPRNRDSDDRKRRICMLITLACHTAFDVVSVLSKSISQMPATILVKTVLALIGFFLLAGCLIAIGDAEGERLVVGCRIGRWHLDVFLIFCACVEGSLFLSAFLGLSGSIPMLFLSITPLPMWILTFGVAWIASWDTEAVSMA